VQVPITGKKAGQYNMDHMKCSGGHTLSVMAFLGEGYGEAQSAIRQSRKADNLRKQRHASTGAATSADTGGGSDVSGETPSFASVAGQLVGTLAGATFKAAEAGYRMIRYHPCPVCGERDHEEHLAEREVTQQWGQAIRSREGNIVPFYVQGAAVVNVVYNCYAEVWRLTCRKCGVGWDVGKQYREIAS